MCVCIYIYIYMYTHVCVRIHIHAYHIDHWGGGARFLCPEGNLRPNRLDALPDGLYIVNGCVLCTVQWLCCVMFMVVRC